MDFLKPIFRNTDDFIRVYARQKQSQAREQQIAAAELERRQLENPIDPSEVGIR